MGRLFNMLILFDSNKDLLIVSVVSTAYSFANLNFQRMNLDVHIALVLELTISKEFGLMPNDHAFRI